MPKNIVVCCDGTGNQYGENNTNVVKMFGLIQKDAHQIAYYDPGIGTLSAPAALTKTTKALTRLLGLAFAFGITGNIEDAYEYLMDKYEPEDRVFLFGFSRGAFTVRALAGMLYKCGLLQKGSNNLIPYASRMYRYGKPKVAKGFKETFSRECKPHFIGVWDTVESVGLISPRRFSNRLLNQDVLFARHAISVDERRSKFRPNLWEPSTVPGQSIVQVWFPGVHSDVGGYYKESGLSDIALKWLIDEARACDLHINQAEYQLLAPNPAGEMHNSLLPLWWVLGWWRRKIPLGSLVHSSVIERRKLVRNYRPANMPSDDHFKVLVPASPLAPVLGSPDDVQVQAAMTA